LGNDMNRYAILVDAGYLLRQSVEILSGKSSKTRADLVLADAKGLVQLLIAKAADSLQNTNLLRVYWYDGIKDSMTAEHKAIIAVEDVQFRAGTINGKGQQKGVDSRIVTDLVELASNQAICDAMLVTGDGDLAIGIELAQRRGVRVAVLGLEDLTVGVYHSQSSEISNIADRIVRIGRAEITPFLNYIPAKVNGPALAATATVTVTASVSAAPVGVFSSAPVVAVNPAGAPALAAAAAGRAPTSKMDAKVMADIEAAVDAFIGKQATPFAKVVVSNTGSVEASVDRALLFFVMTSLATGGLDGPRKNFTRAIFRKRAAAFA
jgi:uncharacterized LabA/DUF88 family protein